MVSGLLVACAILGVRGVEWLQCERYVSKKDCVAESRRCVWSEDQCRHKCDHSTKTSCGKQKDCHWWDDCDQCVLNCVVDTDCRHGGTCHKKKYCKGVKHTTCPTNWESPELEAGTPTSPPTLSQDEHFRAQPLQPHPPTHGSDGEGERGGLIEETSPPTLVGEAEEIGEKKTSPPTVVEEAEEIGSSFISPTSAPTTTSTNVVEEYSPTTVTTGFGVPHQSPPRTPSVAQDVHRLAVEEQTSPNEAASVIVFGHHWSMLAFVGTATALVCILLFAGGIAYYRRREEPQDHAVPSQTRASENVGETTSQNMDIEWGVRPELLRHRAHSDRDFVDSSGFDPPPRRRALTDRDERRFPEDLINELEEKMRVENRR